MQNEFFPRRGLNTREVVALLMMVCAQFVVGVVMLQIMWAGRGVDTGVGIADTGTGIRVADIFPAAKGQFIWTCCTANMNDGEGGYIVVDGDEDGLKAEREKVREDFRRMVNSQMEVDGEMHMAGGINKITSTFLFNVGEMIDGRITSHRAFVLERKDSLSGVLWGVVEAVFAIEGIVAMAGTGTTDNREEAPHHHPRNKYMEAEENIWSGIQYREEKATQFHKIAAEKMEQGDIEGVLKMISETLQGFESLLTQKSREDANGTDDEGIAKVRAEIYEMVEEKKRIVYRGVVVSGEILREMQKEMVEIEGWVEGMRDFLVGICGEVLGGIDVKIKTKTTM